MWDKCRIIFQRMIPLNYITIRPIIEAVVTPPNESIEDNPYERVIGLNDFDNKQHAAGGYEMERKRISNDKPKKVLLYHIIIVKHKLNKYDDK